MLIKSVASLALGMLVCLIAGSQVVAILTRPLEHAKVWHPGTNQIVTAFFGTNEVGTFPLTPEQQASFNLGTNRYVVVQVEPTLLGTNQVVTWRINNDPAVVERTQRLHMTQRSTKRVTCRPSSRRLLVNGRTSARLSDWP